MVLDALGALVPYYPVYAYVKHHVRLAICYEFYSRLDSVAVVVEVVNLVAGPSVVVFSYDYSLDRLALRRVRVVVCVARYSNVSRVLKRSVVVSH